MRVSKQVTLALLILALVPALSAQSNTTCNINTGSCVNSGAGIVTTIYTNATGKIGKPVYMVLAYAPGCPHCEALSSFIANMSKTYDIRTTYINAIRNQSQLSQYLSHYNVSQSDYGVVPVLFVDNAYCVGDTTCMSLLTNSIASFAKNGTPPVTPGTGNIGSLTILELTGLALVDSINPCAFAVLIFLLSTLFMRDPNKRRNILLGGTAFAFGIFIFYLIIGILLLTGIKAALAVTGLSNIYIYSAFGIFAMLLGALNLKDYFAYGSMGFVMEVPRKWRPSMLATIEKSVLGGFASIPGAFIAGVLVTAFLLPCITGPYFVAGSLLKSLPLGVAAIWLVYYNLLFILPMLIITLLVYASFTSIEKAAKFREKNVRVLHLIAGILLILVGIVMFYSVLA